MLSASRIINLLVGWLGGCLPGSPSEQGGPGSLRARAYIFLDTGESTHQARSLSGVDSAVFNQVQVAQLKQSKSDRSRNWGPVELSEFRL